MAEVKRLHGNRLTVRLPSSAQAFDSLLIRDAQRSINGLVETAIPFAAESLEYRLDTAEPSQPNSGLRVMGRIGPIDFCLVNGILGDPLLHVRLRQQGRSLLFDLGDGVRLPARIAHQVTDVFISHAHMDHIGGFMMLLRSRIGKFPLCRLYGPPGLAQHIAGFLQGILWDRVAERAPCFEVAELHADRLLRFRLQAGRAYGQFDDVEVKAGVILQEAGFCIRAQLLDHHTPVLAYAFEPTMEINIRKDYLQARGWKPGPWLAVLKKYLLLAENDTAEVTLPDGTVARVADIAADLILIKPGKKLVYATDLADTPDNRQRLQALAQYAHTFFCEACFMHADAGHAAQMGHLTTRACGEIATTAEVARLVPFHFSQRYADKLPQVYDEVYAACPRTIMPPAVQYTYSRI